MKRRTNVYILIVLVVILIIVKGPSWLARENRAGGSENFRDTGHLILTRHAKCRMDCRDITVDEIKGIIKEGHVNLAKSGIGSKGDSTFALEGYSKDRQHLRIVVSPEYDGLVVITCIDLNKEWPCSCD